MTTYLLIGIIGIFLVGIAGIAWLLHTRLPRLSTNGQKDTDQLMMQGQMNDIRKTLDSRLQESARAMESQFSAGNTIIKNVTEKLVRLEETNKRVVSFADQLKNFENILTNPKQRGILGEYLLETVLKNILPPNAYKLQYKFNDGEIVDAVIFTKEGVIPIDSKFSLENYNKIVEEKNQERKEELEKLFKQDLKRRIDETSKYIRPSEGTMDFAFMFIPAEGIYYDLLVNQVGALKVNTRDLIEYAFKEKRVVIVSPTTFSAYLQTILQGLRAMKIEESAKEIRKWVEELVRHLSGYEEYLKKLGTHLGTSIGMYNSAYREFKKIDKDVVRISEGTVGGDVEPLVLEKPAKDEHEG